MSKSSRLSVGFLQCFVIARRGFFIELSSVNQLVAVHQNIEGGDLLLSLMEEMNNPCHSY